MISKTSELIFGATLAALAIAGHSGIAATFVVTNLNDSGPRSLRQAILDANALDDLDRIEFNIPGPGPYRIQPTSALPAIANQVVVDGTTQPGFAGKPIMELNGALAGTTADGLMVGGGYSTIIQGLVVNGFGGCGIRISPLAPFVGVGSLVIQGNFIGTDVSGRVSVGNGQFGVCVSNACCNTIGGTNVGAGNVISGNGRSGVLLKQCESTKVQANLIGTDVSGTNGLPNQEHGVLIQEALLSTIGGLSPEAGNVIAFNQGNGVAVESYVDNLIRFNSIFANGALGIDLGIDGVTPNDPLDADHGPNDLQNTPQLDFAFANQDGTVVIGGVLQSLPDANFTVDAFANETCDPSGFGEGRKWIGTAQIRTDGSGNADVVVVSTNPVPVGRLITATAAFNTDRSGPGYVDYSSEFSSCVEVRQPTGFTIVQPVRDQTAAVGANATFSVAAVSPRPITYQWRFRGTNLPGATQRTLAITNVQYTDSGAYAALVSDSQSNVVLSATLTVTALAYEGFEYSPAGVSLSSFHDGGIGWGDFCWPSPPDMVTADGSLMVPGLQRAGHRVRTPSQGSGVLFWRRLAAALYEDGTKIYISFVVRPDAVSGSGYFGLGFGLGGSPGLFVGKPGAGNNFQYVLENYQSGSGQVSSGVPVVVGSNALLVVKVEFLPGPDRFTLYVNPLPGAPEPASGAVKSDLDVSIDSVHIAYNSAFAIDEIRIAETYAGAVPGRCPAEITQQPANRQLAVGMPASFSGVAAGEGPLAYQWQRDGTNLFDGGTVSGTQTPTLMLNPAAASDSAAYRVVITSPCGAVTSQVATLFVPLMIVQPLLAQSVVVGGDVTFSVAITGSPPPFGYEWRKVSPTPAVTLASNVSAQRLDFFTLTNVQSNEAGSYRVVARNTGTPSGLASTVALTVLADSDGDRMPDAWENTNRLNTATNDAALDADMDGVRNLDEYIAGTDPQDPQSYLKIERIAATGSATLWFNAASNKTYTVQFSDRLPAGQWTKLADVVARSTNRTEMAVDPASTTNRFYRLVTPRQP